MRKQVTSFSAGGQGHMAFSYWFHPPDNLDSTAGFAAPYASGFWPSLWAARLPQLRPQQRHQQQAAQQVEPQGQPSTGAGGRQQSPATSFAEAGSEQEQACSLPRQNGSAAAHPARVRLRWRSPWPAYGRRRHHLHLLKPRAGVT